jgi:acyl carrier protein
MATVYDRVKKVVVERLGVDESKIAPGASYTEDLNADSLDLVELIMALEEEFSTNGKNIEISDEEAENIKTIQETVTFIKAKGVKDE